MTEEPKVDGLVEDGAVSPPASAVSDSAQKSIADVVTREEFSKALKELRGLQGRQDKAETNLSTAQEAIARYNEKLDSGMSKVDAQKAMAQEDQVSEYAARLQRIEDALTNLAGGTDVGSGVNTQPEATRLIQEYGLDANSADVNKVLAKNLNGLELENALLKLSIPKSPASAPPPKSPSPVVPASEAALVEQYKKELRAAGTSMAAASSVRAKYEELGVNTGAVSFHS